MKEVTERDIKDIKHDLYTVGVIILAIVSLILFAFRYLGTGNTNTEITERYNDYNDGWTLIIDGERQTVDLPIEVNSGKENVIILKKVLPGSIARYSAVATRNYHMSMEVSIDGKVVATYPQEANFSRFNLISDEWFIIDLVPANARSTLEIKLTNMADTPFSGYISNIYYGDNNSLIQYLVNDSIWNFISGFVVMIFSLILIISGLVYRRYSDQSAHFAMGTVLLCFGIWLTNRAKLPVYVLDSSVAFYLGVAGLLMVAPFILLYCVYRHEEFQSVSRRLFQIGSIASIIVLISFFFARHNIQTVAMICYFIDLGVILYNAFLLARSCFGERNKNKLKSDLWIGRIEFFFTILFPFVGLWEMFYYRHQLWTEVSTLYRFVILLYAGMYMVTILWRNYLTLQEKAVVTEKLQESQLELMMGQIQPHFIFNTLSSIRTLVRIAPDTAYNMLYDFSNYLRANVDNITNLDGISFAAEVEHIKSYTNIEKVRFGDRLNMEYDINVSDFMVPPLSIQPLVENAVKHGVCQKPEGGVVTLRSYGDKDSVIVEVSDTGVGLSQEAINKLFSVYLTHEDPFLTIESDEVITNTMREIVSQSVFLDADGTPMNVHPPTETVDYSGNGSENHKSTGMLNIILRLKEIAGAKMTITSRVGVGTNIKLAFPVEESDDE